jgi:hypothetical protein
MTEFDQATRKRCRNPLCRSALPSPVSNDREAFCCRGCYGAFYRKRCRVCEAPIDQPKRGERILCDRPKCRSIWAMKSGFGHFAPFALESISEVAINQGVLSVPNRVGWRIIAGPPLTPSQFHCATVGAVAAISDSDLINSAHWRAAKDGEWSYRLPDGIGRVSHGDRAKPAHADAGGIFRRRGGKFPHLEIPADLTIPAFLRRDLPRELPLAA